MSALQIILLVAGSLTTSAVIAILFGKAIKWLENEPEEKEYTPVIPLEDFVE